MLPCEIEGADAIRPGESRSMTDRPRELLEKGSDTTGDAGVNRDALAAEFHRTRKLAGAPQ